MAGVVAVVAVMAVAVVAVALVGTGEWWVVVSGGRWWELVAAGGCPKPNLAHPDLIHKGGAKCTPDLGPKPNLFHPGSNPYGIYF